jgi:molecular chaperone Hsp33
MTATIESGDNFVLPFQVGDTAVRGRVARLGGAVDEILRRHDFPDPVSMLLGEATVLVAMMGASLKFDGKLIFQAQGDGPAPMAVADYSAGGALRATAKVARNIGDASGLSLIGTGHIVMTIDQGPDMERYQGVTPLDGSDLSAAAVSYFNQSEQIPTAVRLAVGRISAPGEPERWRAGGIMAQFVPGEGGARERGEEILMGSDDQDLWDRADAFVQSTNDDELLDPAISAETLLYRLFHEDGVRVFERQALRAECSCNSDKIEAVLGRYNESELADMVEDGAITVTCEFCRRDYRFTPQGRAAAAAAKK